MEGWERRSSKRESPDTKDSRGHISSLVRKKTENEGDKREKLNIE